MIVYVCNSCGKGYFEPRGICKCGSDSFREEERETKRLHCVKLLVPPAGFPEQVEFCLSSAGDTRVLELGGSRE
ncbi:hypothetical protein L3N51_02280 [Metallosphaera sp. J1]|uniref:hypothetical protein n=1 Tax=Metallosphaera TaxID=41980 RepID=UPI001EE0CEF2|nr:hypothetical protein [Metallosphaera javensis (ex Hofmann et al. 2022)]MCG3109983.1 hypothetical protein [Metallosphaera javensis (ex Hofmann et al. 2022)]BCS93737.1 MAG: hypothetical protein MjAS7_2345 [Metallosphaera javensis (ex Sakai et al. 2022)]